MPGAVPATETVALEEASGSHERDTRTSCDSPGWIGDRLEGYRSGLETLREQRTDRGFYLCRVVVGGRMHAAHGVTWQLCHAATLPRGCFGVVDRSLEK